AILDLQESYGGVTVSEENKNLSEKKERYGWRRKWLERGMKARGGGKRGGGGAVVGNE
ncbi:hypothetical protein HAX54_005590, partial [Datura stramonium]|nr:hypothetical protein [Datura stramonium]